MAIALQHRRNARPTLSRSFNRVLLARVYLITPDTSFWAQLARSITCLPPPRASADFDRPRTIIKLRGARQWRTHTEGERPRRRRHPLLSLDSRMTPPLLSCRSYAVLGDKKEMTRLQLAAHRGSGPCVGSQGRWMAHSPHVPHKPASKLRSQDTSMHSLAEPNFKRLLSPHPPSSIPHILFGFLWCSGPL
ncbi:hypothetical protein OBBRIDRAFT_251900 [Obba rivulosa]|uniref:Uncharacterized protein n=1 Tax=Obba rivulosa TaxID=1052685 RepID=A0A8E2J3E3_9APHY|nr:hypothetical protein OBBRIDRAFT_251900 [Obba rivulosa]